MLVHANKPYSEIKPLVAVTRDNFQHEVVQSLTRGKKAQSRRERETQKQFLPFREEKEKFEFPFTNFEKRKRN